MYGIPLNKQQRKEGCLMMTILGIGAIIGLILLIMVEPKEPKVNVDKEKATYILKEYYTPAEIVIIDSCEYLYLVEGHSMVLTHKGNCKHCKTK
jgi:hypothetical protein